MSHELDIFKSFELIVYQYHWLLLIRVVDKYTLVGYSYNLNIINVVCVHLLYIINYIFNLYLYTFFFFLYNLVTITADKHLQPTIRSICSVNHLPLGPPTLPISINLPTIPTKKIIDKPNPCIPLRIPRPTTSLPLVDPLAENINEIQAARLIVIRRKKMKKHKLRKLRKRMKYVWAKVRQKREMRKEKAFQAELMAQVRL